MVAGPQVGYFNPQILMEQDVHAPAGADGPGIDAQGASFVGINLYVQLGRGRDYAWSATSAGQDIIDTFALELCDDTHYRFRGRCEPIEVLEKTNRWVPTPADQTAPGSQTLHAERTKLGLVAGRGKVARQAGDLHPAALDLLPRGRQRRRLHGLQHARGRARRRHLPARRVEDRLHVQLALRRLRAHRVLQLGREPGAREGRQPRLPGRREVRVAGLEPGHLAVALHPVHAAPAGRRPALLRQLEQQAGARLPLRRRERLLLDVPLGDARGPRQGRHRGRRRS